jgi:hypothetical protein
MARTKAISKLIEDLVEKNATEEGLREAGFIKEGTEATPKNVKSATTRYRNSLRDNELFLRNEEGRTFGETVTEQEKLLPRKQLKPEELEGMILTPHMGDLTKTNFTVKKYEGVELDKPITSRGGYKYPLTPENQRKRLAWASMRSAAARLQNKAESLEAKYDMPVAGLSTTMGEQGNFFNDAFAALSMDMIRKRPPSRAAVSDFDRRVRAMQSSKKKKSEEGFDDEDSGPIIPWVGIDHPDALKQLLGTHGYPKQGSGKLRGQFMTVLSAAEMRKQGFPNIRPMLNMFTEDEFRGVPLGYTGGSISKLGRDGGLIDIDTHLSYDTGILGDQMGGFGGAGIPTEIVFPDIWRPISKELTKPSKEALKKGAQPRLFTYAEIVNAIANRKEAFQVADARWVDTVSTWMEKNPGKSRVEAVAAVGLPAFAFYSLLDPQQVQAAGFEAIQASMAGEELTEDQLQDIEVLKDYEFAINRMGGNKHRGDMILVDDIALETDSDPIPARPFVNDSAADSYLEERSISDRPDTSDLRSSFRASRQPTPDTAARIRQEDRPVNPFTEIPGKMEDLVRDIGLDKAARGVGAVAGDVAEGVIIEAVPAIAGGVLDAVQSTVSILDDLGITDDAGSYVPVIETQPDSVTGQFIRDISQFVTGFIPANRALQAAGVAAKAGKFFQGMSAGAIADAFVFDPKEDRFANVLKDVGLDNAFLDYLAADGDDTALEGRFKNALEGVFIGGSIELISKIAKSIKAAKQLRETVGENKVDVEQAIDAAMRNMKGGDGPVPPTEQTPRYVEPAEMDDGQEFLPFDEALQGAQRTIAIEPPEFGTGDRLALDERAKNINLANLDTPEDVQTLIDKVAEADAIAINEGRREQVSNDQLQNLANDLGMTVEKLLSRRQGQGMAPEEILAARQILVASGENLVKLAKQATTGSEMDLVLFRRAMTQHRAIQQQVSGMTAEAGRALQQFRIAARSQREQEKAIKEALEITGGEQQSRAMAEMLAELDTPEKIGKFVKEANTATNFDVLYEAWINGLLSSPTTHAVNVISNTMTAALTIGERKIASVIGNEVQPGEATAQLKGAIEGAKDGLRLAWTALRTGEPTDQLSKLDQGQNHRALSAETLGATGKMGIFTDYVGAAIRTPGKLLTASDEFFKAVGYRMELHALAYRTAFQEGLKDEAAARRVVEILENPPSHLHMQAVTAARYQTFTNSLDELKMTHVAAVGQLGENWRSGGKRGDRKAYAIAGLGRVVLPFIRTPTNILSYTLERTPFALASRGVLEELAAGGARRDLAMAKLVTGSMIMGAAADMALSGQITGGGPQNPDVKKMLRNTGWQPYSIKIGNKYYAYNRLDPVGALLGLSADMAEVMAQVDDQTAAELGLAAVISVGQNLSSKSYLTGVSEFFDVMSSIQGGADSENIRALNYLGRMGATGSIPFYSFVSSVERAFDPTLRRAFTFTESVRSKIPGLSADLPPIKNIFAEPVVLNGGISLDTMSGIYTSEVRDQKTDIVARVSQEIVDLNYAMRMPQRNISGVDLDVYQYDRYIQLIADDSGIGTLAEQFDAEFKSIEYQDASVEEKQDMIESLYRDAKSYARDALLQEYPEIQDQIDANLEAKYDR